MLSQRQNSQHEEINDRFFQFRTVPMEKVSTHLLFAAASVGLTCSRNSEKPSSTMMSNHWLNKLVPQRLSRILIRNIYVDKQTQSTAVANKNSAQQQLFSRECTASKQQIIHIPNRYDARQTPKLQSIELNRIKVNTWNVKKKTKQRRI